MATQDEAKRRMTPAGYSALLRIGAKKPLKDGYRGSFAFIGYSGKRKPSYVQQVMCLIPLGSNLGLKILKWQHVWLIMQAWA